jgi:hypothetical protein
MNMAERLLLIRKCSNLPREMAPPNLLNQLVLWKGCLQCFNLIPLCLQYISTALINVLQKKDLDILGFERLQLFGGGSSPGEKWPTEARWRGMEGGGW